MISWLWLYDFPLMWQSTSQVLCLCQLLLRWLLHLRVKLYWVLSSKSMKYKMTSQVKERKSKFSTKQPQVFWCYYLAELFADQSVYLWVYDSLQHLYIYICYICMHLFLKNYKSISLFPHEIFPSTCMQHFCFQPTNDDAEIKCTCPTVAIVTKITWTPK